MGWPGRQCASGHVEECIMLMVTASTMRHKEMCVLLVKTTFMGSKEVPLEM